MPDEPRDFDPRATDIPPATTEPPPTESGVSAPAPPETEQSSAGDVKALKDDVDELKQQLADPAYLAYLREKASRGTDTTSKAPVVPPPDDEALNEMTPGEVYQAAVAATTKQIEQARAETLSAVDERARNERAIAEFAAEPGHELFPALRRSMASIAAERPDTERKGLQALYDAALKEHDDVEAKRQAARKQTAHGVSSEKPRAASTPGSSVTTPVPGSLDDAMWAAQKEALAEIDARSKG